MPSGWAPATEQARSAWHRVPSSRHRRPPARRRGAVEHYFRARPRSYIGHQDWRKVPRSVRSEVSGASLEAFIDRVIDALEAGTIDDRDETTLSWTTMAVDQLGWTQATEVLEEAIYSFLQQDYPGRKE